MGDSPQDMLASTVQLQVPHFVEVLLPLHLDQCFTYRMPSGASKKNLLGHRVVVPFRQRVATGIIWGQHSTPLLHKVKEILAIPDAKPLWEATQRKFFAWVASYYMIPRGTLAHTVLSGMKSLFTPMFTRRSSTLPPQLNGVDEAKVLFHSLPEKKGLSWTEVKAIKGLGSPFSAIELLAKKKAIDLVPPLDYVRPAKNYIALASRYQDREAQKQLQSTLSSQRKQYVALQCYLAHREHIESAWVPLTDLHAQCVSPSALQTLVRKGIFLKEKRKSIPSLPAGLPALGTLADSFPQTDLHQAIEKLWEKKRVVLVAGQGIAENVHWGLPFFCKALLPGEQALYLLPSGQGVPPWLATLRKKGGEAVAFFTADLPPRKKLRIWQDVACGAIRWIVGTREALFLPFLKLVHLVISEAEETTHSPKYSHPFINGRDAAIMLAYQHQAKTLLTALVASAESYYNVKRGKYGFFHLRGKKIPSHALQIVVNTPAKGKKPPLLSPFIRKKIAEKLSQKSQVVLLHHRAGYATYSVCPTCRWIAQCPTCSSNLSYHTPKNALACTPCNYHTPPPPHCPQCQSPQLQQGSLGIEQLEELAMLYWPGKRTVRLSGDILPASQVKILHNFEIGNIDILITTPHSIKRLPFHKSAFIVIPDMDRWLRIPHFRTEALCYQWLATLISNRDKTAGNEVWIQTSQRKRGLLQDLVSRLSQQDDLAHYEHLLAERATYGYPPYKKLLKITIDHPKASIVYSIAKKLAQNLQKNLARKLEGPIPTKYAYPETVTAYLLLRHTLEESSSIKAHIKSLVKIFKQQGQSEAKVMIKFSVDAL